MHKLAFAQVAASAQCRSLIVQPHRSANAMLPATTKGVCFGLVAECGLGGRNS